MVRLLIGLIVLLAVLTVSGEFFLPELVARGLEAGLRNTLIQEADLSVSLNSYPALKLLLGRFDSLTVETRDLRIADLKIKSYSAAAENVVVNLRSLLRDRRLIFDQRENLQIKIVLTEKDLNDYLWKEAPDLKDFSLRLLEGAAAVVGTFDFLGNAHELFLGGQFVPQDDRVILRIDEMRVDSAEVSETIKEIFLARLNLYIDLTNAPAPLKATKVTVAPGSMTIEAVEKKD